MEQEYKPNVVDTHTEFAQRLRKYLKDNHLTQEKFAELVDADDRHVKKWLAGVYLPNTTSMLRICRATGLSADYLMGLGGKHEDSGD